MTILNTSLAQYCIENSLQHNFYTHSTRAHQIIYIIAGRTKEVSLAPPGIDFSLQKQANRGRTQAQVNARRQHDQKSSTKCKHGVTNGNNLESSKWREGMKCPKCWKEYTADHGRPRPRTGRGQTKAATQKQNQKSKNSLYADTGPIKIRYQ